MASSAGFIGENPMDPITVESKRSILACPVCYGPFTSVESNTTDSTFQCNTCKNTYFRKETHLDLTVACTTKATHTRWPTLANWLFRFSLISYFYERGWRQNFKLAGFPGPKKEFEMAKEYLKPVLGGNIIDASCGSGLFSRLFAKSGLFSHVVALDYSANMLRQCNYYIKKEKNFPEEDVMLVRADISKLPFVTSSIDAVHAGAALHCWPSPSLALAEIVRVLRPGGVFVATTFVYDGLYHSSITSLGQVIMRLSGFNVFKSQGELEDLCSACGLVDLRLVRNKCFLMISATKPAEVFHPNGSDLTD